MSTVTAQIKEYLTELRQLFEQYKATKEKGERFAAWIKYFARTNHFCKIVCSAAFDKETQKDQYLDCFASCSSIMKHVKDVPSFDRIVERLKQKLRELGAPGDVLAALGA